MPQEIAGAGILTAPTQDQRASRSRQLQQLIVTIFGLYARGSDKTLGAAELVELLATLDVDEAAARSALSRLKKRGVLISVRKNTNAAYRLDPALDEVFQEGDARIFEPHPATPRDRWVLAAFTVPESRRPLRHQLRRLLASRGFGAVGPGLWIAPGSAYTYLPRELKREGLDEFVQFFMADIVDEDIRRRIAEWWDLNALEGKYHEFLTQFEQVLSRWQQRSPRRLDGARAFADYVLLLTEWRRLPYLDPGVPAEYLPPSWAGTSAWRLFSELHRCLSEAAGRHVAAVRAVSATARQE